MKINLTDLFGKITAGKKMIDSAVKDISTVKAVDLNATKNTVEETGIANALINIDQAYKDGDKELLINNSTTETAQLLSVESFSANRSFFVRKHEKIDTPKGQIVVAEVVLQEPGRYYLRNFVLMNENGAWKYDRRLSEEYSKNIPQH